MYIVPLDDSINSILGAATGILDLLLKQSWNNVGKADRVAGGSQVAIPLWPEAVGVLPEVQDGHVDLIAGGESQSRTSRIHMASLISIIDSQVPVRGIIVDICSSANGKDSDIDA